MAAAAAFTPPNLTALLMVNHTLNHVPLHVIPIVMNISGIGPHYGHVTSTSLPIGEASSGHAPSHVLAYVLVPLGSLLFIAVISFLVVFLLRKKKLDKLRHHLMPLYNFDPAEEEGDWESELLEEDKEQTIALNRNSSIPMNGPTLKFRTEGLDV